MKDFIEKHLNIKYCGCRSEEKVKNIVADKLQMLNFAKSTMNRLFHAGMDVSIKTIAHTMT